MLLPSLKWLLFYETDNSLPGPYPLICALKVLRERSDLAAVGFRTELSDGRPAGYGCRKPSSLAFALGQNLSARLGLEDPKIHQWTRLGDVQLAPAEVLFTSPLLVRHAAWQDVGGMDSRGFPYTDSDVDWCMSVRKRGWGLAVLDIPGVVHDNGSELSPWSQNRVMYYHQSRLRLLRKHNVLGARALIPVLFMRHLMELVVLWTRGWKDDKAKERIMLRRKLMRSVFSGYAEMDAGGPGRTG